MTDQSTIVVAGATGNLGGRIARALVKRGAVVRALVRAESAPEKLTALEEIGVKVVRIDMHNVAALTEAMRGAACVVSALQGLRDVIVDAQSTLLDAAVAAGVPRFIPSDYSSDFTRLPAGDNRNFDLRREFHDRLAAAPIESTAIFNGAFAELLRYNMPLFDMKKKSVGYWEDADYRVDFTTMDDTADFTAAAAMDPRAPTKLNIASFQISPRELGALGVELTKQPFELVRLGSRAELAEHARRARAAHPEGEKEVFPDWQRMQYMLGMFSVQNETLDNARYGERSWTSARDLFSGGAR
jgi:uncharacterized protein YbjT (DUF2867 family)